MVKSFGEWLLRVVEHWELIVATGAIPFFIDLVDKFFDWKMPKKLYAIFVGIGLVLAMFMTWHDEREKSKAAAVYLIPDPPQVVVDPINPRAFPVGKPPQVNLMWKVFGQHRI